ncbi:hypothetical protein [Succinimonas sp.]|uniref:hypothetical protein n=1 Tax=Succinimonas sp. TaxID=1936151 RepID=UPI00386C6F34
MSAADSCSCPGCSGNLVFDISAQALTCAHCGGKYPVPEYDRLMSQRAGSAAAPDDPDNRANEQTSREASPNKSPEEAAPETAAPAVYACSSCGGEITPGILGATDTCPFCGNAIVLADKIRRQREPDMIIPFALDKTVLMDKYRELLGKARFVPDSYMAEATPERIQARYVPFWLYDVSADGSLSFEAKLVEHTEEYGRSRTVTHKFRGKASGHRSFRNIPQDATSEVDDEISQSLEPYDTGKAQPFSYSWLSGLDARIYNMDNRASFEPVKARVRASMESYLVDADRYTKHKVLESSYEITPKKISYALFPIWTMELKWKGGTCLFAMNGQTGACSENIPTSGFKLWTCSLTTWFFCSMAVSYPFIAAYEAELTDSEIAACIVYGIPFMLSWCFQQFVCVPYLFKTNIRSAISGALLLILGVLAFLITLDAYEFWETLISTGIILGVFWCGLGFSAMKDALWDERRKTALMLKKEADYYAWDYDCRADREVEQLS